MNFTVTYLPLEPLISRANGNSSFAHLVVPTMVVGPENAESINYLSNLDYSAAADVSPIVIYGPAKSGKSVLACRTSQQILGNEEKKSAYIGVSGTEFCKQFSHAHQTDDLAAFRKRFRSSRCIVIDNLEGFTRSEAAQRELVHLLDDKQSNNTVLFATASCVPASLRGLSSNLLSRLMGGLVLEIRYPGIEAKRELLRMLCEQIGAPLRVRDREFLLNSLPPASSAEDVRTALTVFMKQRRDASDSKCKTPKFDEWLATQHERTAIDINEIAKSVAKRLGVPFAEIKGNQRKANVVRARGLAIYLARNLSQMSLQEIGEYFGGRDHTTILHSYRKTEREIMVDPELARASQELQLRWRDKRNS